MKKFLYLSTLLIFSVEIQAEISPTADLLNETNEDKIHALVQPTQEENVWKEISWHSDIWSAREEAAKEGKPVYLWEMDGHPLGCV